MPDTTEAVARLGAIGNLEELYGELARVGMGPGWNKPEPSLWPAPRKTFVPAHWSWRVAEAALHAAGPLINTALAERRNLILSNPVEGNTYGTSRTLVAAYQMVMAGETARSHRHTPNALRLVVKAAPGTYTVVQGRKIPMLPGDVLLTPNWLWHGHSNESREEAYWIDVLDAPLVQLLEPMFLEHFPDGVEPAPDVDTESDMRFPFEDTMRRLDEAEDAADGSREVELTSSALRTIGLHVLRLQLGRETAPMQTTASNIYAVVDGSGSSTVDGRTFEWSKGDVFVAPGWRPHTHWAGERAHLLRVTDEPVLRQLGWLRNPA